MATLANLVASLRSLARDGPTSKTIFDEQLGSDTGMGVDGSNKNFRLKSFPVVINSVYVTTVGTNFRSQSGFTLTDPDNGILVFASAPANAAVVKVDYNYMYLPDDSYIEFLNQASENLQLDKTPVDPTSVTPGLVPAMMQYALANFYKARFAQYAEKYSSSGGMAGQSIDAVGKGYLMAAEKAEMRGDTLRKDYWTKQGQNLTPAYAGTTAQGSQIASSIDPITPIR